MLTIYQIDQRTGKRRALVWPRFSCEEAAERWCIRWTLIGPRGFVYVARWS